MSKAFISFGSNLKDRIFNCRMGISEISRLPDTSIKNCSSLYETEPTGTNLDAPWYINGVLEIETPKDPNTLLRDLLLIEKKFGRIREPGKVVPRTLDLDLLLFDNLITKSKELILPHPRMHLRKFVLIPLVEISPGTIHPILNKSVKELLAGLFGDRHHCERYCSQ